MKTTTKKTLRSLLTLAVGVAALSLPGWARAQAGPPLGQYEGRLPLNATFPNDSHLTNGYLCVKVSAKRAITGTVALAGFVYRIPKGIIIAPDGTTSVVPLTHRTGPPAELQITSADADQISGLVNRVGRTPIEFGGMSGHALQVLQKYSPKSPFPFAGLYTVCLDEFHSSFEEDPMSPGWIHDIHDEMDYPGRYGYGLVKISSAGRATVKGQLPDGTKYTSATCARAYGADLLSLWVYAPILKGTGSVVGPLFNEFSDPMLGLPTLLTSGFDFEGGGWRWYVGDDPQPLNNRTWVEVNGSEYNPPAQGEPILGGGDLMTNVMQGIIPVLSPSGITAEDLVGTLPGAPDPTAKPAVKYLASVAKTGASPSQVDFQFNPKTGAYKATFVHPGTTKKTTAYGAVIQWDGVFHAMGYHEELVDVEPGGHCGVFVTKVRQPDRSTIVYPGWTFYDTLGMTTPGS